MEFMKRNVPRNGTTPRNNMNGMQNAAFARDIRRAYEDELNAMIGYVYAATVLGKSMPSLARLFDEIARVELAHFEELGQLLLYLGADPTPNLLLRPTPLMGSGRLGEADLARLAEQKIISSLADEGSAEREYRRLAEVTENEAIRDLLLHIASEEAGHQDALKGMQRRMSGT